jgi:hypothetical protein
LGGCLRMINDNYKVPLATIIFPVFNQKKMVVSYF